MVRQVRNTPAPLLPPGYCGTPFTSEDSPVLCIPQGSFHPTDLLTPVVPSLTELGGDHLPLPEDAVDWITRLATAESITSVALCLRRCQDTVRTMKSCGSYVGLESCSPLFSIGDDTFTPVAMICSDAESLSLYKARLIATAMDVRKRQETLWSSDVPVLFRDTLLLLS